MLSWIFRNRARLGVIYGQAPSTVDAERPVSPGGVLRTEDGVLLGPWGRRSA